MTKPKNRDKNFEMCFGENSHPFNEEKHEVFRKLQECFRNGMIKVIKPKEKPVHWDCMTKLDNGLDQMIGHLNLAGHFRCGMPPFIAPRYN